jgi:DNA-binding NarL/FixJ family response regulator
MKRILIIGTQPLARLGLRAMLAEQDQVEVVGETATFDEAARLARDLAADVALAAWEPAVSLEIAALTNALHADGVSLILIGDAPDGRELSSLLAAGVRGFLLTDASADEVAAAVSAVTQGLAVLDPPLGLTLAAASGSVASLDAELEEDLTTREHEVLALLALGLPNKIIASRLLISEHTVKFHVGSIMTKLGAASRTEAVTTAARRGLLTL